jgi:hypothetical protein
MLSVVRRTDIKITVPKCFIRLVTESDGEKALLKYCEWRGSQVPIS